ncbi:MAG: FAD-binding protein [Chloroflexi bacterium]|nr:MAG: fumarate reductase (quinol) flavoprotein subunit [Actinobacteria bacterium 13_2_20CM_2_66_6]TMD39028.1 MAG: FAD-binding protein [Chloroflexota bacterium]
MEFESYDVLVVGGGLAGIRAAIAAVEANPRVRVGMVSKVYPMRSHTVSAEGGAAAALAPDDSYETHAFDTIKGSDYLADQDVVEAFVREAPVEVIQMEHWGCPWSRNPDGTIAVRPFGGMTTWRTCYAADKTGFHMLHTVFQTSLKYPQITRHDEAFVTKLLVEDSRCVGVVALDIRSGRFDAITAKSVILATGGLGRVYAFTTNGNICTGDGMALAYRAGAALKDMEMVQFHPTGLPFTGILITEAVRGEGGYLLNNQGERFLKRYVPNKMELGPRDIISRAMVTEFEAGRGFDGPHGKYMHLDVRHLGEAVIDRKLPFMRELGREFVGIDIVTDPIPVRPVQHYMMGGVDADISGATPILGLYAAGECANVGLNGGNRLGSNSLSECLVFGAAAGRAAAHYAASARPVTANPVDAMLWDEAHRVEAAYLEKKGGDERIGVIREEMQKEMDAGAGVFRTRDGLSRLARNLGGLRERFEKVKIEDSSRTFNTEITAALELDFMLEVASAITFSALAREESRGAHSRLDFPERDDKKFLKHTVAFHTNALAPRLEYSEVTITNFQPQARTY